MARFGFSWFWGSMHQRAPKLGSRVVDIAAGVDHLAIDCHPIIFSSYSSLLVSLVFLPPRSPASQGP